MSRNKVGGLWIVVLLSVLWSIPASADVIDTYAGNGTAGFSGDGGPATQAGLYWPRGVAVDGVGNLYIADMINNRIRKVDVNGIITTVAGNGFDGYTGDGGPATQARLSGPRGVVVDGLGNLYFADGSFYVRKVDVNGIITTVVGTVNYGFCGDGGPATQACIWYPWDLAIDGTGNLYIADTGYQRIRKVDTNGIITTVVGGGASYLYGSPATEVVLRYPRAVTVDGLGNIYIADDYNRIAMVDANGSVLPVAGNLVAGYSGDGGLATQASLNQPRGVAVDLLGNVYIGDSGNNRVRKVDTNGIITTVAGDGSAGFSGDGGPAIQASLNGIYGVEADGQGNIYINDSNNNRIRKVSTDTTPPVTTLFLAGTPGENNWYWSDVLVTLTATDSGSGVARTEYSFDAGGTWNTYTGPFTVTAEGSTVIDYRSIDNAGNVEPYLWDEVKIDRTAPVIVVNETSPAPANGATNVSIGQTITVTFTENVQAGANYANIKLYRAKIEPGREVTTSNNVAGNVLYIDPVANLNPETTYRVVIPAGSVKDMAGHPLAADFSPYSFDTALLP